jgi:hypothetical protein
VFTDRTAWRFPYGLYAIYLHSFVQFSLFADATMLFTLTQTNWYKDAWSPPFVLVVFILLVVVGKIAKLVPYLKRNPSHIKFFPFYILFAYFHSFLRLWALLTFWDCSWSGRNLDAISHGAEEGEQRGEAQQQPGESAVEMDNLRPATRTA